MERVERHLWLPMAALGLVMAGLLLADGLMINAAVVAAVLLTASWWMAPWRGRGVRHDDLPSLPARDRRVVVYWRPGCAYCSRLKRHLGAARRHAIWVNIWADDEAEAYVRSLNDGDAVVPTVVIDGEAHTNPEPAMVRARL